ncbi:calcium-transporting ATPase 5, plasma membrane-type-like [Rosa rugosa]|uniref:calcium-transporting ATPase 5, plasma membrane-type-like n=1 Tax=Rosa rugosa TaxID=74645 RepID=UPI002B40D0A6|nr:calcium-transporting ATPase 5, plasma membrane-type-like [Rosa rugosa]
MENYYLKKHLEAEQKHLSWDSRLKWRKAAALLRSRRFRGVVDLANQARAEIQGSVEVAVKVQRAAILQFDKDELASIKRDHDIGSGQNLVANNELAMGIAGTQVARGRSDVIKLDHNFRTAASVARWNRAYINIQNFMQFQLAINVVALVINAVSGRVSGNVPLTTVQLLWVNLNMYTVGACSLIQMPQFLKGTSFVTRGIWRNIIGQSIYQLTVLGVLNFYGTQLLGLTSRDAIAVLDTVIFNSIVFCKMINEMIQMNRHEIEMINTFDNWILVGFMICTLAFEVVIVEFLGVVASIVPLWLLGIFIGSVSMTVAVVLECTPVGSSAKGTGDGMATEGPEIHRFSAEQLNAVMKLVQEKFQVAFHCPKTALLKINNSAIFRSVGEVRISAQMMQCTCVVLATFVVIVRVGDNNDFAFSMLTFLVKQNINGITTIVKFWLTFAVDYGYASVVIALLVMIRIVVEKVRCNEIDDWSSRDATRFVVDYALAMLEYLLFLK